MNTYEGNLIAQELRFALVVSRFNEFLTNKLLSGALDTLKRHGASEANLDVIWVPGAFEIPLFVKLAAESGKYDAVIALGAIIRGETPHFDYVAGEASKGIAQVSLSTECPVMFGIVTADTLDQAIARTGTKAGNKGADAAVSAIECANLKRQLKGE
jgi:6,7-dimethyl-8-ribityllumazine synthase